jgi:hypothetical protein
MNKKIASEFAIGVLIVLALIFAAIFWFQGNQVVEAPAQPIIQVPQKEEPKQVDETASWQTYKDMQKGFEFKYPVACKINNENPVGAINLSVDVKSTTDDCNFGVAYYDNLNSVPSDVNSSRKSFYDLTQDPSLSAVERTSFQNNNAFVATFENKSISLKEKRLYVSYEGRVYELSFVFSYDGKIFDTNKAEKILSTFQFTNGNVQTSQQQSKPNDDPRIEELRKAVFTAVENELNARYQVSKDPGYKTWSKKINMSVPSEYSQEVAKGKWWTSNDWDWIAWLQENGTWKVLVSFDGFDCKALESVPTKFDDYFKDVIYPVMGDGKNSKNKYCYQW